MDCWYSDILNWWKLNESYYPRLAALAKYYLSIPASSNAVLVLPATQDRLNVRPSVTLNWK